MIPLLWQAQKQHDGWLPKPAIEAVAAQLGMPLIRVMEVATFYTMFNLEPVGRYFIQLCGTVPCHVKGALDLKQALLDAGRRRAPRHGGRQFLLARGRVPGRLLQRADGADQRRLLRGPDAGAPDRAARRSRGRPRGEARPAERPPRRPSREGDVKTLTGSGALRRLARRRAGASASRTQPVDEAAPSRRRPRPRRRPSDPKPAKPDAGRATERPGRRRAGPARRSGETPSSGATGRSARRSAEATRRAPATAPSAPPQSGKSYTATPSKPDEGRAVADAEGTTPDRRNAAIRRRAATGRPKPVGADPDAARRRAEGVS